MLDSWMPQKTIVADNQIMPKDLGLLNLCGLTLDYGVSSHIGQRRTNQDAVHLPTQSIKSNGSGYLFAVADGMGGHYGGGIASQMACDRLKKYESEINCIMNRNAEDFSRDLTEEIIRIDRSIRLLGLRDKKLEDMGTTLSCLIITQKHSIIAHVGDSRIYRFRKGHLTCLTFDHTFVQDMIFEDEVDPQKAHLHPLRHMLTRAVGAGEPLNLVDTRIDPLKQADRFLLCTDGLFNAVADSIIIDQLSADVPSSETSERLVMKALQNDARDNITALVIKLNRRGNNFPTEGG
jgi:protein phosphatase